MLHEIHSPSRFRIPQRTLAGGLGIVLSATVGLGFYLATARWIEGDARERFRNLARNSQYTINARIKSYTDLLRGAASLFNSGDEITRGQFHRYVKGMDVARNFPAIETINFARYVTDAERPAFEAHMRERDRDSRDGYPPFAIKPEGHRAAYSVLTYIEPIDPWSQTFGLDIAARPAVAEALNYSRDQGTIVTSGQPIAAMSNRQRVGLGMRLPIYRYHAPLSTVNERRAAYLGSVGIAFNVSTLLHGVLDEMSLKRVRLTVYDSHLAQDGQLDTDTTHDVLLFDSDPGALVPPEASPDHFLTTHAIPYNDRIWRAVFSVPQASLYTAFDSAIPWLAALAGFISTLLLYALFQSMSTARRRAVQMAKAMTKELRESQIKLQLSHEKLRALAAHSEQIKEGERKRIAREIHDDLGQNLLALRIEADLLASRTRASHARLHARAVATLQQIDATIRSVRQIINDLRPNVLDLGLPAAVEWQVSEFQRRTGITCEFSEPHVEINLNDNCATAFFRVLQESLSNISRHAAASHVKVDLQLHDGRLTMTVSDNGIGLRAGGRNKVGSFGLVGIEERMAILGGAFSLISSPGAGTTVRVSVPLPQDEQVLI
ncbi:CHASE domain-containing protein [Massilia sp. TS11]|uniref:sensor histidine kinase n=1 Tax=Massilia sp. TS11 TaxID=2908003 RepID=UPI001EDB1535|nr:CHASE domain-containing protein [Massilia sp. TS11]MCG2585714.1 CHASE domain-containing protein [Massilia sp. TS11]